MNLLLIYSAVIESGSCNPNGTIGPPIGNIPLLGQGKHMQRFRGLLRFHFTKRSRDLIKLLEKGWREEGGKVKERGLLEAKALLSQGFAETLARECQGHKVS